MTWEKVTETHWFFSSAYPDYPCNPRFATANDTGTQFLYPFCLRSGL